MEQKAAPLPTVLCVGGGGRGGSSSQPTASEDGVLPLASVFFETKALYDRRNRPYRLGGCTAISARKPAELSPFLPKPQHAGRHASPLRGY